MRILLTGPNGQVGTEFRRAVGETAEIISATSQDLDLSSEQDVRRVVRDVAPDVIVNAGAFTAVDAAEQNWDLCFAVNAMAPVVLAEEAHRLDALLIHFSSDYVFDGTKGEPYTEEDPTSPLNVYGASKAAGEEGIAATFARALVLRTSWLYSLHGENFLTTILRLATQQGELRIVADQVGAPTSAKSIAIAIERLIRQYEVSQKIDFPSGIYHLTASGQTSRFGFATAIMNAVYGHAGAVVTPIATAEHASPSNRPRNSVLSSQKFLDTFGFRLSRWQQQIEEVAAEIKLSGDLSSAGTQEESKARLL